MALSGDGYKKVVFSPGSRGFFYLSKSVQSIPQDNNFPVSRGLI